ncbi:MAG TPA: sigma-70 family RNA polymerase sigma factor [Phycisphaerae bacterium]|nr:sigma-70 family RNA polymerase sigma factor [Phycisphaerae bacterium]
MQDLHETSNEHLMARFQARLDGAAIDEIVSRFMTPALAVARRILPDAGLAEDAVQEALLRVVRNRRRYDPARPFSRWFYTIVRNVCRDMLRRQARHAELVRQAAAQVETGSETPGDDLPSAEGLLSQLPPGERNVLVLRVVSDMPFDEIGIALGISTEAAKKRAQRGLRRLRERRAATMEA